MLIELKAPTLVRRIRIDRIDTGDSPLRHVFDEDALDALTASVRNFGIAEPLLVTRKRGGYLLVSGERRLIAAKRAGLDKVPCVVARMGGDERLVSSLLCDMHREQPGCFEAAEAIYRVLDETKLTCGELSKKTGISLSDLERKLSVLRLDGAARLICEAAGVGEDRVLYILSLLPSEREKLFEGITDAGGTLEEKAALLRERLDMCPMEIERRAIAVKDIRLFFNTINRALEVMNRAGVRARAERRDSDDCVEYLIKIPAAAALR